jgi:RNA polymerase sigma-70 factor (ECF subfamily)
VIDEQRWIKDAQRGDVEAFNLLVERHQLAAYNLAYRTVRNVEEAADATQEAFLSAHRAIRSFHGSSFRAWLSRIVVNACYDAMRHSARRAASSIDALVEEVGELPWADERATDPERAALSAETRSAIEIALAALPEDQRLAIVLVDIQGLAYEEAAEALACPIGTVRSRLARGRARVRDELIASGNLSVG